MKQFSFYFCAIVLMITLGCTSKTSSHRDNGDGRADSDRSAGSAFSLGEAKNLIQEKRTRFTQSHITGDTAFLNNIFTNDAKVFAPNSDVVVGRKAIADLNTLWVSYNIKEFSEESTALYGNEDYLIDEGTYFMRYGNDDLIEKGKYINIWKPENGEWKLHSNIWNSSMNVINQ
jgi:ketosteroid isomerase-like protein